MGLKWVLLPVLALYWFSIVSPADAQRVVCYYGSWAVYRPGKGKFDVEDIDPNLCTHIIFGFVGLSTDGRVKVLDTSNEIDKAAFERFSCLKKVNPNLKALIAIGGRNEGSTGFSTVSRDAGRRATFIRSAIDLIERFGYDGFDLDWEYPNQRGGIPEDVGNFVTLVKEFRAAFQPKGLLITAAVAACQSSASLSYNIPEISKYLDFINVMTYDMHGCWDYIVGHNAPLRGSSDGLDVETCVGYWLASGAPPGKLNLGIGLYGRGYALSNANNRDIGAAASQCGQAGPYTRENGILGYNEICKNNWPRFWHDGQKVPYAVQNNQWFGYDDPESIGHKITYLKSKGLGGAMVWSLETDDFLNSCGGGRNPLLNAIRTGLGLPRSTGTGWGSPCANRTITCWSPPTYTTNTPTSQRVVCYYGSWAVYRPGEGKFDVEDIDPYLCTHIIFGFVGLSTDGTVKVLDSWNEIDKAAFERFSCLKKVNPNLKALIAIGGWNEGSTGFSTVARDAGRRATFIKSAIDLIERFGYDGFDLDWEYPNQRGGIPEDVENFVTLVKEFRAAFQPKGLLITAAVAACQTSASLSYNIPEISKYLDFINIMTYDMHGCWDYTVGHNAPLCGSPDGLDVVTCVSYWINSGAPPGLLNLGIGLYGRGYALSNTNNRDIGAAASGCGQAGPYTRENGILGYNEICKNNWPRIWHDGQKVPYAVQSNQWFGYDDPESIGYKIEWAKSKGLGGAMVWSLETDDFLNSCGGGRNPLLNAIRTGLGLARSTGTGWGSPCANRTITWWSPPADNGGGGTNPGNDAGSGTNPGNDAGSGTNPGTDPGNGGGSNPAEPPAGPICSTTGYVRDSANCGVFYYCQANGGAWAVSTFTCPAGTLYNTVNGVCDWPYNVVC